MTKCVNTFLVSALTCDDQLCWRRMVYQDLVESLWTLPKQSQSVYPIQRTESFPLDRLPTSQHEHAWPFWCVLLLAFRGSVQCYSAGPIRRPLWNIANEYHQTETNINDKSTYFVLSYKPKPHTILPLKCSFHQNSVMRCNKCSVNKTFLLVPSWDVNRNNQQTKLGASLQCQKHRLSPLHVDCIPVFWVTQIYFIF